MPVINITANKSHFLIRSLFEWRGTNDTLKTACQAVRPLLLPWIATALTGDGQHTPTWRQQPAACRFEHRTMWHYLDTMKADPSSESVSSSRHLQQPSLCCWWCYRSQQQHRYNPRNIKLIFVCSYVCQLTAREGVNQVTAYLVSLYLKSRRRLKMPELKKNCPGIEYW